MGERNESYIFQTETEAKQYADKARDGAVSGYSEVYVTGPYQSKLDGFWHVSVKTYYG